MRLLVVPIAALLAGCSMAGQPMASFSKKAVEYPSDYMAAVRHYLSPIDPDSVEGSITEPATLADSAFGPQRWYVCYFSETGHQSVLVFYEQRVASAIPGPSPHFCDGRARRHL